jgi:hypothetical protein
MLAHRNGPDRTGEQGAEPAHGNQIARCDSAQTVGDGLACRAEGVVRTVTGAHDEASAAFECGLSLLPQIDIPFEGALLRLAYAAHLRRNGGRKEGAALCR